MNLAGRARRDELDGKPVFVPEREDAQASFRFFAAFLFLQAVQLATGADGRAAALSAEVEHDVEVAHLDVQIRLEAAFLPELAHEQRRRAHVVALNEGNVGERRQVGAAAESRRRGPVVIGKNASKLRFGNDEVERFFGDRREPEQRAVFGADADEQVELALDRHPLQVAGVAKRDLHVDAGKTALEFGHDPGNEDAPARKGNAEADGAAHARADVFHLERHVLFQLSDPAQVIQERLAFARQLEPGTAMEKFHAVPLFEPPDVVAQALRRDEGPFGGAGKIQLLSRQQKHFLSCGHDLSSFPADVPRGTSAFG